MARPSTRMVQDPATPCSQADMRSVLGRNIAESVDQRARAVYDPDRDGKITGPDLLGCQRWILGPSRS